MDALRVEPLCALDLNACLRFGEMDRELRPTQTGPAPRPQRDLLLQRVADRACRPIQVIPSPQGGGTPAHASDRARTGPRCRVSYICAALRVIEP